MRARRGPPAPADGPDRDGRPAPAVVRIRGECLGPRRGDTDAPGQAGRLDGSGQEPRLLADRLDEQRVAGRQGGGERDARQATAGAEVEEAVDAAVAQGRRPRSGCRRRGPWPRRPASRTAVRLMACVHARSRRMWPSMAARCAGSSVRPRASRPASTVRRVVGRQGRGVLDVRRERLALALHGTPPRVSACQRARRRSRRRIVSHHERRFGLPRSIRFTAGFPRAPRGPRYPGDLAPVRERNATVRRRAASTGVIHEPIDRPHLVDKSAPIAEPSAPGASAARDRSTERPADDVDHFVDVLVRLALGGGGPDAAGDVVLEDRGSTARRRRRAARRSAGGCRRSTPRARSSGRCPRTWPSMRDRRRISWAVSLE